MYELKVKSEDNGKRFDNVTTKNMVALKPDLEVSRSLIQKMIEKGQILLNGSLVKSGHKVRADDSIQIDMEKLEEGSVQEHDRRTPKAEKLPLDIIYEDEDILVVNKPAGMVVHPACGNYSGTLVNALLNYPGFLTSFNERREAAHSLSETDANLTRRRRDERRIMRPGIVHRLDKDTSGIMLVAKNGSALRNLSRQLKNRTIEKKYIAIVRGVVELDEGIVDFPISHDKKDRRRMAVDEEEGKEATTYFRVIKRDKVRNFSVMEIRPKTGRTHQIRIHLAHIGHPILGDRFYNGPTIKGLSRQALHARSISFVHPKKAASMEFSADIPEDMKRFMT